MYSRLLKIFSTFTFRLALIYVALFSVSVVVVFTFIYAFAVNYLEDQVRDDIRVRLGILRDEYRDNGSTGVETRIRELIASDDEGTEIYLIVNREQERLTGNLNEWPKHGVPAGKFEKDGEWLNFKIEAARGAPAIEVSAVTVPISKWRMLLVGRSLQNKHKVENTIIQTFWASLLVTLLLALIGAGVMTRSVMRRLGVINRSAESIMEGNFNARVPFTPEGDEFDELSNNLNRMLDRIQMLLESLGQFANNIAHDLRSPLTRIIGRTDAGLRGLKEQSAARRLLERNVQDMEELVATFNAILKISDLEANTAVHNLEACDLTQILTNLVEFYEPLASEKRIQLTIALAEPVIIQGEKLLLTQAFANLLDNALKFTPEGGLVSISYQRIKASISIIIADTGSGIPPEFHERVFQKFFRLEKSRHTRGNGLGLSMVAAIVRIHNAQIELSDNQPGLKVTITFPVAG